jgi:uncharacterized membrane protein YfcA
MLGAAIVGIGFLVGTLLGLAGGGGGVVAVPLLVYLAHLPGRSAVALSASAIALTAVLGAARRTRQGQVEWPTGVGFAAVGMLTSPLGALLAQQIPERALLIAFALLIGVVAVRMWVASRGTGQPVRNACRTPTGELIWSSRCALLLVVMGAVTGVLSGLFGVGGGFIIVPSLVLFTGMPMQRAIGTSLLVISLVSSAAFLSHWLVGNHPNLALAALFAISSLAGMFFGERLAQQLTGPALQKVFACLLVGVAIWVITQTMWLTSQS